VAVSAQNAELSHQQGNPSFKTGDSEQITVYQNGAYWGHVDLYINRVNNTVQIGAAVMDGQPPLRATVTVRYTDNP
jgi:hypothetical protein